MIVPNIVNSEILGQKVYRYLRPKLVSLYSENKSIKIRVSDESTGGITFAFYLTHSELHDITKVKYLYSICDETDNFNKKIGRSVVNGRTKQHWNHDIFEMNTYDPQLSLIQNAYNDVVEYHYACEHSRFIKMFKRNNKIEKSISSFVNGESAIYVRNFD